jgi:cellulose synthase/poly-beta-1,6-N-acetylglucosamine synthase-like glycosyltransferase
VNALLLLALAALVYTYIGYPILAALRAPSGVLPVGSPLRHASVTVIIAARDEARVLPRKLASLFAQGYPMDRVQVLVVSDGSRDETAEVARQADPAVEVLERPTPAGKPSALNLAAGHSRGEILVLTDARQPLRPGALEALVAPFSDPTVGAVTGEIDLGAGRAGSETPGLYRRYDDWIRRSEARRGSAIGVTGALWALRRSLFTPLPPGTLADDLFLPLMVVAQGKRVVCAPAARATDEATDDLRHDFRRRVRTLAGNFQLIAGAPWLLRPDRNPAFFSFVSHKVLRLTSPLWLALLFLGSLLGAGTLPAALLALQIALYGFALAGCFATSVPGRIGACARASLAFVSVNAAVVAAGLAIARGRGDRLWRSPACALPR